MFIQYWIFIAEYSYLQVVPLNLFASTIIVNGTAMKKDCNLGEGQIEVGFNFRAPF